jgi:hypothetical protein
MKSNARQRIGAGRYARHICLVPDCGREAFYAIDLRMRRPDTGSVWARSTGAYFCDDHVRGGTIKIDYAPTSEDQITVSTRTAHGTQVSEPIVRYTRGARPVTK